MIEVNSETQAYRAGTWRRLLYTIELKTNKFTRTFNMKGRKGGTYETYSNVQKIHLGFIDINKICEILMLPLSKDDLLKISNESDVVFLRQTAKRMLQN